MKKPLQQDLGGAKAAVGEERRRSQRVMIRMPVTLRVTVEGKELTLPAFTVSVNDHGAMLMCGRGIPGGTKLELRNEHTGETQTCRVTRTAVESQQSFMIPVEFAAHNPGFWHISFPPDDWKPTDN